MAKSANAWAGPQSAIGDEVRERAAACLAAYRANPPLVEQDINIELSTAEGGYEKRQLYELIQNGADELLGSKGGRIHVLLSDDALYCANEGNPITVAGVRAILLSHISQKRGAEIGRFGLGFKSVLEITDSPQFYSRSGSFVWDYEKSRGLIAEAVGGLDDGLVAPRLRLAYSVDAQAAFAADPILAELSEWATTIVKLPCDGSFAWLTDGIATFPMEFLLFCRHVGELVLEDRTLEPLPPLRREIKIKAKGKELVLSEDGEKTAWRLFSTIHTTSEEARADAGEMSNRDVVPIHWALPVDGRPRPGTLWAFFPTEYQTTLSGIINAPWKTNPDRRNLLDGPFNRELLRVVARLVADHLEDIATVDDPGLMLELLPGRLDRASELKNWAEGVLNEEVYALAAELASLPNLRGELTVPAELTLHPRDIPVEILEQWAAAAPQTNWCHPSIEKGRDRRPRVERLIELGGGSTATLREWLEFLVQEPTPEASKAAIGVAAAALSKDVTPRWEIQQSKVVLTESGTLVDPDPAAVFLPSDYEGGDDVVYVHSALATDPGCVAALEELGIAPVDATAEFENLLSESFSGWGETQWDVFWRLSRRVGADKAAGILRQLKRIPFVRVRTGRFRTLRAVLLPGSIIPEDSERDLNSLIDVEWHEADLDLLKKLGAVSAPVSGGGRQDEPWYSIYLKEARERYLKMLPGSKRPQLSYLDFSTKRFVGPLTALETLSVEGAAVFTQAILAADPDLEKIPFGHSSYSVGGQYPEVEMDPPTLWMIKRAGCLSTSIGPRRVTECLASSLSDLQDVLPVADCSDELAARLGLPVSLGEIPHSVWETGIEVAAESTDDVVIGRFYGVAAGFLRPPEKIRCRVGDAHQFEPPSLVTVVSDRRELEALRSQRIPVILATTAGTADELRDRWGLSRDETVSTEVVYAAEDEPVPVVDRFPPLRFELDQGKRELEIVTCSTLSVETVTAGGRTGEETDFHVDGKTVYVGPNVDDAELLRRLAPILGLSLDELAIERILKRRAEAEQRELRERVRAQPTPGLRLLAAVGAAAIRAHLPRGLLKALETGSTRVEEPVLAELVDAVYGVDMLHEFRRELGERGFDPPDRWAGSSSALQFVHRLGFAREFAGSPRPGRPPLLEVEGPPGLPPLHPFQREVVDEFRDLLRGQGTQRALLSLPTGAGKTRVAVEALIESAAEAEVQGPILWIAQGDELCEQAVQTWSEVWRSIGPIRGRLAISRLWSTNEAEPIDDVLHVVVATIDKLAAGVVRDPEYDWLRDAGCVVIDEAHHSITPSYTEALRWLDLGGRKETRPLVGLTATPFRGVSEEETKRLVDRYGARRLDFPAFGSTDPYPVLQSMGVLAHVRQRSIDGVDIELNEAELAQLNELGRFPGTAAGRLGLDVDRNQRLIDAIGSLDPDWTVLLFATSVDHAQTMAALLTREGISAKPITSTTEQGARRHYVDEFRQGRLRVLTNYGVLTTGFDAPAVRSIVVARPTFSPNLYQQMIGRGLRGPLNGGKDECLIINVEDNVQRFEGELAFRAFEYLWDPESYATTAAAGAEAG